MMRCEYGTSCTVIERSNMYGRFRASSAHEERRFKRFAATPFVSRVLAARTAAYDQRASPRPVREGARDRNRDNRRTPLDIIPDASHGRAEVPTEAQRSPPVRNSAARVKSGAEITFAGSLLSDAARISRSRSARSSRTNLRSPVNSLVPAQKSQANPCHSSRVRSIETQIIPSPVHSDHLTRSSPCFRAKYAALHCGSVEHDSQP